MISGSDDLSAMICAYDQAIESPEARFRLVGRAGGVTADSACLEDFLVRVLGTDDHSVVRHEAAFVLGLLQSRGCQLGKKSLDALCRAVNLDKSVIVVHEAAESLGYFDSSKATKTLRQLLRHSHPDVRATAEISLEAIASR